jgi:branched-chain amino acid transport system ATP-binding protein
MTVPVLELDGLAIRFGGVQAVANVSFAVAPGELIGMIGPNGAGKTTLIRLIAGILRPDNGRVLLSGRDVTREPTAVRVRRGLALTHQIVRPFRRMTVLDNVVLAAGHQRTESPIRALFEIDRGPETARAQGIIERVGLAGFGSKLAASLPLGQLKRLELARALALEPAIMLLDEPLAGLNSAEAAEQVDDIARINAAGTAVVLVEHNLEEVIRLSRRLIVLSNGSVIGDGLPREVMSDPAVREAYLGDGVEAHAKA